MLRETEKERKKAYMKAYYAANATVFKARDKAYYAANANKKKAREKAFYSANTDKIKARNKAFYAANIDVMKAQKKVCRAAKADDCKEYHNTYRAKNADHIKAYIKTYIRRVKGCVVCKDWPDWRQGRQHYDNLCYRCFCEKYPGHEKVRTKVRVELQVRAFINSHFSDFVHDRPLHTAHCDCPHRRRIDHRRVVGNTLLCIETDEHAHRGYDKDDEQARYHDVFVAWSGKLCFVRMNPDGKGPPIEERLERLHAEILRHIGRLERGENASYLEVHHLYYPKGTPDLYEKEHKPEWLEAGACE